MKRNILLAFLIALFIYSCTEDVIHGEEGLENDVLTDQISLSVLMPEDVSTKMLMEQKGLNVELKWELTDELHVCFVDVTDNTIMEQAVIKVSSISDDRKKAVFSFKIPKNITSGSFHLYGLYGGQGLSPVSGEKNIAVLPNSPINGGSVEEISADKRFMLTFKQENITLSDHPISINLTHLGSLFCIRVKNIGFAPLSDIKKVALVSTTDDILVYEMNSKYNLSKDVFDAKLIGKEMSFELTQPSSISSGEGLDFWGWFIPMKSDSSWPALALKVFDSNGVERATSSDHKIRTLPAVSGKAYYIDAYWDGVDLTFNEAGDYEINFLFSASDLTAIRLKSQASYTKEVYSLMKNRADSYLAISTNPYNDFKAGGSAISGRSMQIHTLFTALTGLITDDERYINKSIDILCSAAENTTVQDAVAMNDALAVGDAAYAYSLGYSWTYHYMSESQRTLLQNEIMEYGSWLYNNSFVKEWGHSTDNRRAWNWNGVTHGALGVCGLALNNQSWIDRATERSIDYFRFSVDETGAAHEGIYYLSHGLHYVVPFSAGLKNRTGRDLIQEAGVGQTQVSNHILNQSYPWGGGTVNINQSDGLLIPADGFFYLLTENSDQTGLWAWLNIVAQDSNKHYGQGGWPGTGASLPFILLWADSSLSPVNPKEVNKPLSIFYDKGDVSMRSGWEEDDCLVTFNCGNRYQSIWNHADAGAVTLSANGDVIITDLGPGNVSSRYHNVMMIDGVGQSRINADGTDRAGIHSIPYSSTRMAAEDRNSCVYVKGDLTQAYKIAHAGINSVYRQLFFKREPYPYLIVVDDVNNNNANIQNFASQFFTKKGNSISIDDTNNQVVITSSKNQSKCLVRFYSPSGEIAVSEDNSTGNKALIANVVNDNTKIVSVFCPYVSDDSTPIIEISGSDIINVTFRYMGGSSETVTITQDNIIL